MYFYAGHYVNCDFFFFSHLMFFFRKLRIVEKRSVLIEITKFHCVLGIFLKAAPIMI